MTEQAKILAEMQKLVMDILKKGDATEEEGNRLHELEDLMLTQKCYKSIDNKDYQCIGEEIASLFFNDDYNNALDKMLEFQITPEDLFGFIEYHYDEDEEDEEKILNLFTASTKEDINNKFLLKNK